MGEQANSVMSVGVRLAVYLAGFGLTAAAAATAIRASTGKPAAACDVPRSPPVAIVGVLEAGLIEVSGGGQILLSGIETPRSNGKGGPDPFAKDSLAAAEAMLKGQKLALGAASTPSKRGYVRAQAFTSGGKWIQGELVSKGLARVRTFPDRRECAGVLLALEAQARSAKRGLWASDAYAVLSPARAASGLNAFQIVEGQVVDTANIRGRVFLNFGADYKTDFTVHIGPESAKLLAESGVSLASLKGKRIRARGWVRERNGPVIDVTAPEQLQILD